MTTGPDVDCFVHITTRAASIDTSTATTGSSTGTADIPEEYTRGQVDDQPLSPVDEAKGKLEKLITNRPDEKELVEVGTRSLA